MKVKSVKFATPILVDNSNITFIHTDKKSQENLCMVYEKGHLFISDKRNQSLKLIVCTTNIAYMVPESGENEIQLHDKKNKRTKKRD